MIEKRGANFHGMRHAHAVAFGQNVVGQIIFLIKPEKRRRSSFTARQFPQLAEDFVQRLGKGCETILLIRSGERAVPVERGRVCGDMSEPSSMRRTLYSKPIFSSETGQYCNSARPCDGTAGKLANVAGNAVAR